MENKSFNIVVIHKQSGWRKFKRRLSSFFSSDKVGEPLVVPEIIVTSHEDIPGNILMYFCSSYTAHSIVFFDILSPTLQSILTKVIFTKILMFTLRSLRLRLFSET